MDHLNTIVPSNLNLPHPIQIQVPLQDKNWFKTGGCAQFYCEPQTAIDFQCALQWAYDNKLPLTILGEGANILINDEGIPGLVIHPKLHTIRHYPITAIHTHLEADCGVSFGDLIQYCLDHQLIGLEEFSGIPGTVGGSVFINIHYFEFLLSNFIVHAQVIHKNTGIITRVDRDWFNFGYNYSTLHNNEYYLLSATFLLRQGDALETAYAQGRSHEIIRHRKQRYPKSNTCGSFFRNFYPSEVTLESNGTKLIYVAYYLDKIGVKGQLAVGDAIVSYQHANMLVNRGKATSNDLIGLAKTMQELVFQQFGIIPQPECRLLGFSKYPLL